MLNSIKKRLRDSATTIVQTGKNAEPCPSCAPCFGRMFPVGKQLIHSINNK
jgi:hypothetical protein